MFVCPIVSKLRFYECCHPCFYLEYIPSWEDIPMTSEFWWKKTSWQRLLFGKVGNFALFAGKPCMCYRRKGDDFVRVSEHNIEFLHQLQENKTLKDGIFREKYESGETKLGYQYFDRTYGNTGEARIYSLNMTVSGDIIQYLEQIFSRKTNLKWKVVTAFQYNKETFTWSKVEL